MAQRGLPKRGATFGFQPPDSTIVDALRLLTLDIPCAATTHCIMADQSPYPYPSPTTQLEQLAGAAQQASSPGADFTPQRPPNPRKRKAESGSGSSRGVANLTPEQLAKKRANDREAQRAIRERTRNTIESLEARIKELESQQPFQELQNVIRSRDAIVAENEELKRRLASICALAQPQNTVNHGLNGILKKCRVEYEPPS